MSGMSPVEPFVTHMSLCYNW